MVTRNVAARVASYSLTALLGLFLLVVLLAAPVEFLLETVELTRMDASTVGLITKVELIEARDDHVSRPVIRYEFADGRRFVSDRLLPGYAASHTLSSDGDAVARRYSKGQRVTVHYCSADPEVCAIEYGWFDGTFALTALVIGIFLHAFSRACVSSSQLKLIIGSAAAATALYGLGIPIFSSPAVWVADLPRHALGWTGLFAACTVYRLIRGEPTEDDSDSSSRPRWTFVLGGGDD